jgi:hypothetical protein
MIRTGTLYGERMSFSVFGMIQNRPFQGNSAEAS